MRFEFNHETGTSTVNFTTGSTSQTITTIYDILIESVRIDLGTTHINRYDDEGNLLNPLYIQLEIGDYKNIQILESSRQTLTFDIGARVYSGSAFTMTLQSIGSEKGARVTVYRETSIDSYAIFEKGITNATSSSVWNMSFIYDVNTDDWWKRNDDENDGYPYVFKEQSEIGSEKWKIDETGLLNEGYPYLWWEEGIEPKPPKPPSTKLYFCENGTLVPLIPFIDGEKYICRIGGDF